MTKLVEKEIGAGFKLKMEWIEEGGKLSLSADHDTKVVDTQLAIKVEAGELMDMIAEAIPGKIDDAILGALKSALKAS